MGSYKYIVILPIVLLITAHEPPVGYPHRLNQGARIISIAVLCGAMNFQGFLKTTGCRRLRLGLTVFDWLDRDNIGAIYHIF